MSGVPGTTRETVELDLDYQAEGQTNPGSTACSIRRTEGRKRIDSSLDYFSAVRTKHAVESVDIVFLVLDAREGVTKQDKVMAHHVWRGRALSILVNKWDLALESFRKDPLPGYEDEKDFRKSYLSRSAKSFTSSLTHRFLCFRDDRLFDRGFSSSRSGFECPYGQNTFHLGLEQADR